MENPLTGDVEAILVVPSRLSSAKDVDTEVNDDYSNITIENDNDTATTATNHHENRDNNKNIKNENETIREGKHAVKAPGTGTSSNARSCSIDVAIDSIFGGDGKPRSSFSLAPLGDTATLLELSETERGRDNDEITPSMYITRDINNTSTAKGTEAFPASVTRSIPKLAEGTEGMSPLKSRRMGDRLGLNTSTRGTHTHNAVNIDSNVESNLPLPLSSKATDAASDQSDVSASPILSRIERTSGARHSLLPIYSECTTITHHLPGNGNTIITVNGSPTKGNDTNDTKGVGAAEENSVEYATNVRKSPNSGRYHRHSKASRDRQLSIASAKHRLFPSSQLLLPASGGSGAPGRLSKERTPRDRLSMPSIINKRLSLNQRKSGNIEDLREGAKRRASIAFMRKRRSMVADKLMSGANLELMRLATEKALELNGSDDNNSDTNDENSAADVEDDVFMDPEESEDLILMPGFSVFRWYWDIVRLLGLLFYITIVPIRFIHVEMNGFDPSLVVGWLFDLFFFVDIVLNMLVFSFVIDKETNLFADRNLIRQFYLQSWDFIVDVCSVFFFPAVLIILAVQSESSWKHVKILRCFALIRTPHFSRYLGTVLKSIKKTEGEGTEPSILKNQNLQNVANIVLYQLIIIYWSACIWLGLSQWIYADDANKNWLFYFEIVHPATTLYEKYISALSWSSSTLYSVGYGNTYARNDWERVLSVTVMIFGFVMQNSLIGFLVPFLKARTIDRIQFQNRVRSLADMIRSKALDQKESLQEGDGFLYGQVLTNARYLSKIAEKVTQYREYIWIRQKGRHENSVLDDMPEHLRLDLLLASCGEALTKTDCFRYAPMGFVRAIMITVRAEIFAPNDSILYRGNKDSELAVVVRGMAGMVANEGLEIIHYFQAGFCIGEEAFLSPHTPVEHSVVALTYSNVFLFTRQNFEAVLGYYPTFKEYIYETFQREEIEEIARRKEEQSAAEDAARTGRRKKKKKPARDQSSASSISRPQLSQLLNTNIHRKNGSISNKKNRKASSALDRMHSSKFIKRAIFTAEAKAEKSKDAIDTRKEVKTLASHMSLPAIVNMSKKASRAKKRLIRSLTLAQRRKLQSTASLASSARSLVKWSESTGDGASLASFLPSSPLTPPLPPPPSPPLFTPPSSVPPSIPPETITAQNLDLSTLLSDAGPIVCISSEVDPSSSSPPCLPGIVPMCNGKRSSALNDKNQTKLLHKIDCEAPFREAQNVNNGSVVQISSVSANSHTCLSSEAEKEQAIEMVQVTADSGVVQKDVKREESNGNNGDDDDDYVENKKTKAVSVEVSSTNSVGFVLQNIANSYNATVEKKEGAASKYRVKSNEVESKSTEKLVLKDSVKKRRAFVREAMRRSRMSRDEENRRDHFELLRRMISDTMYESMIAEPYWLALYLIGTSFYLVSIPSRLAWLQVEDSPNDTDTTWVLLAFGWTIDIFFVVDTCLKASLLYEVRGLETRIIDDQRQLEGRMGDNDVPRWYSIFVGIVASFPCDIIVLLVDVAGGHSVDLGRVYLYRLNRLVRVERLGFLISEIVLRVAPKIKLGTLFEAEDSDEEFDHDDEEEGRNDDGDVRSTLREAEHEYKSLVDICIPMIYGIFFMHVTACFWLALASWLASGGGISWLEDEDENNTFRYVRSLCWILVTAFTVGYGDIVAESHYEVILQMVIILSATNAFICLLAWLNAQAENSTQQEAEWEQRLEIVNKFMKVRQIPIHLRERVDAYHRYMWSVQKGKTDEELMEQIPPHTRVNLLSALVRRTFHKMPVFKGCESGFIDTCILLLHLRTYSPGDFLYYSGDYFDEVIFIYQGVVTILSQNLQDVVDVVGPGSVVGEQCLTESTKSVKNYCAESFVQTAIMSVGAFQWAIEKYPKILEEVDRQRALLAAKRQWFSMNSDTGSESLATAVSVEKAQVDLKTAVENAKRKKDILRRKEQQQSIRIFKPTSKVCIYWNLASMVMLSLYGFIIPLRLAFPLDGLRMTLYYMDSFIDLFFVVDMIFRFRYFARISNGVLIEDRTEIGEHYLRQEFKYDLFGTLVIDTLLVFLSFDVVAFLRLFRMMHVHRLSEYFDTLEGFIRTNANISLYIIRLMKQMLILLGFIHWAACCWHYIAEQENASNSWVNAQETLVSRSVDSFSRYLQSVYFVIVTTATVGFGDIKPKTEIETFFGVCLIGIGCIQYGTAAANVASIASNSDITASSFNRKLQTVTDFIRKKDMPSDLGDSLVHFYSNLWETHKGVDENSTLDWMPLPLRRDLCTTWYGKYVFNFPLFRNLPTVFAVRAAVAMNVQSYVVGELLVERNSGADSLFIVFEGKGVMEDEMGRPFCRMPPGSSFGMENLRFRRPRLQQFTVRALRNTSVLLFDNAILEELCNLYGLEFRQKLFRRIDELMILEEKKAKAYKVLTAFVGYSIQRRRSRRLFGRSLSLAKDKSVKGSNAVTRIRTMPHTKTNKADADIVEKKSEDDYNGNIIDEEPNNGALLRLCVWLMTFVISPGSIFFKVWSSLRLCGDFFYVITTPIIIAFRMYPLGELSTLSAATIGIWSVGWTFDMFFGIDLYLRMHRILDREAIISQSDDSFVDAFTVWRRFWKCRRIPAILYDFVLVFPFDIIILVFMRGSDPDEIVFARLNRILYMFSMSENMKIIDLWIETFTTVDVSFHGRKLIAIFVYSLTFLHITACLWKAVGDPHFRYVHGNTRTWYQLQPEMETGSGLKQYLICLYFSIVTFTTTGYGEITPTTKFEVVFTVLVIFVGNVISAAFIGNVSAIAAKVTEEDHVYQKQIENLHHYMRSRNVRKTLRDRFHEYFEYIHENDTLIDDFKTFALLPYHLRKRTKHYLYGPYLEGLDFLSKDSKFFLQLADCLRPQIYLKDDIVVKKGDIGLELYVVVQGECQRVPVSEEVHGDMVDLKANRNNLGVYSPSNSVKRDYKNARKTSIAGLGQGSFERKKSRVSSNFGMASGATATHSSPSSTLSRMMRPHRSITIQHTGETSPPLRVGSPSMSVSWKSGAESTSFPSPTAAPSILMKGFQFGKHSETVTSGLDEQVVQGLLIRTNDNGAKEKIVGAEKDSDACGMKGEGTGTQMPYADDEDFPVMEAGDFFGDIAFVTASTRTCSVKALSSCQLLVLDRNDWDELMVAFPKVERICTLSFRRIWRTKWRYKVKMESDGGRTLDCMYEEMLAYEALEARREKVLYNITKLWKTGILANR